MTHTYIALDFETTGIDPILCSIIEFGAAKIDTSGNVLDKFCEFSNAGAKVPIEIIKSSGINDQLLEGARKPFEVWADLLVWSGRNPIFISHNAKFEAGFIKALYSKVGGEPDISFICTYEVAKKRFNGLKSYKLADLVPELGGRHRALPDALACIELYKRLAATYTSGKIPHQTYLTHLSRYEMYDRPTSRQKSYITSLGGNPLNVKTKSEASAYIDDLKSDTDKQINFNPTTGRSPKKSYSVTAQIVKTIFTLVVVTVVIFWAVAWILKP